MFSASEFRQTIPSKSTIVPSDHQLDYKDGDTIRFEIPKYIGFIDPRQSFLSMKVSINSPAARAYFTNSAQSIINNLRIWDLESSVQMENVENYAELVNLLNHYESNRSIDHKRELLEGKIDDAHTLAQSNWFNQYSATEAVASTYTYTDNEVQICLPLKSGVLGGNKVFPFALTGGRIELDTNAATKVLEAYPQGSTKAVENNHALFNNGVAIAAVGLVVTASAAATAKGTNNATWVAKVANYYKGWRLTNSTNGEVNYVVSHPAVVAGAAPVLTAGAWSVAPGVGNQLTLEPKIITLELATAHSGATSVSVANSATNPFKIGQQLEVVYPGITTALVLKSGATPITIAAIQNNILTFSAEWDLPADATGGEIVAKKGLFKISSAYLTANPATYTMKDIELVLKQVSPPATYVNKFNKAGSALDIYTYDILRNNVSKDDKVAQQNIPAYNTRAKAILSLPMPNQTNSLLLNNLAPALDNLQNYNYYIEGLSQPNKKVPTAIMAGGYEEPIQLWELIKALGSCGVAVKNIQNGEGNFAIGRSLGMYGGVYNLREAGDLSLRTEYNGLVAATKNKLFLNYICHIRRLVVNANEKKVIL